MFTLYKIYSQMIYTRIFNNKHDFLIFSFALIIHEEEGISEMEGENHPEE